MKRLFSCGNSCDFKNKDTCHKTKEAVAISQLKILPVLFLSIRGIWERDEWEQSS